MPRPMFRNPVPTVDIITEIDDYLDSRKGRSQCPNPTKRISRTAPFVYPFTVDGLAEFKVMVQDKDLEKTKDLLTAMPAADEENGSGKAG